MSASGPSATVFSIGYDFHLGNGDNGNVYGITNYRDNSRNQSFAYDSLNRLTSAQNAGTNCSATTVNGRTEYWGNAYGYDPWGNLLAKNVTKCSAENLSVTVLTNNQLSGYSYDAAGNMTSDPTDGVTATYDAESRILTASKNGVNSTYTYNSLGNRVRKDVSGGPSTEYFNFNGQIVAELNPATGAFTNYVYFDGDRVARRDGSTGPVSYYFSDHLKTASVVTDALGNIKEDEDYYPWGGELQFVNSDSNHYKFTGKERDSETGLDYFGARYYSNGLGRFVTPDWAAKAAVVPYAEFADPQSLNLYSYVRNVPTTRLDPDGHCPDACVVEGGVAIGGVLAVTVQIVGAVGTGILIGYAYDKYKAHHGSNNKPSPATRATTAPQSTPAVPPPPPLPSQNGQNSKNGNQQNSENQSQNEGSKMQPKPGSKGGPGAGKDFSDTTKAQGLAENQAANDGQAKCVFCGENVGEGTENKINYDHAIPKVEDGNNTLDNLNVACEYCNKSKGTSDAPKNPKSPN